MQPVPLCQAIEKTFVRASQLLPSGRGNPSRNYGVYCYMYTERAVARKIWWPA